MQRSATCFERIINNALQQKSLAFAQAIQSASEHQPLNWYTDNVVHSPTGISPPDSTGTGDQVSASGTSTHAADEPSAVLAGRSSRTAVASRDQPEQDAYAEAVVARHIAFGGTGFNADVSAASDGVIPAGESQFVTVTGKRKDPGRGSKWLYRMLWLSGELSWEPYTNLPNKFIRRYHANVTHYKMEYASDGSERFVPVSRRSQLRAAPMMLNSEGPMADDPSDVEGASADELGTGPTAEVRLSGQADTITHALEIIDLTCDADMEEE